jgi:hypothetical protein
MSELEDRCSSVVSRCCQKLEAEAGDRTGTQRKGNVRRWKPLPSNGSEDVTWRTRAGVCVRARVCVCVTEPFYSHTQNRDNTKLPDDASLIFNKTIELQANGR